MQAKAPDSLAIPTDDNRPVYWVETSKFGDSWLFCKNGALGSFHYFFSHSVKIVVAIGSTCLCPAWLAALTSVVLAKEVSQSLCGWLGHHAASYMLVGSMS